PFAAVIFGATGDLAARKLLPALFNLWEKKFLPASFAIAGVGRRPKSDSQFRDETRKALANFGGQDAADNLWNDFAHHLFYQQADFTTTEGQARLAQRLKLLEKEQNLPGNRLFYLATDPEYFAAIVEQLSAQQLVQAVERPWSRVVIEKPFGHDLASA